MDRRGSIIPEIMSNLEPQY